MDRLLTFFGAEHDRDEVPHEIFPTGLAPFVSLAKPPSGHKVVQPSIATVTAAIKTTVPMTLSRNASPFALQVELALRLKICRGSRAQILRTPVEVILQRFTAFCLAFVPLWTGVTTQAGVGQPIPILGAQAALESTGTAPARAV